MTEKFHFILYILVWLYANIKLRMAKMNFSSYILILTFFLLSQGISLSASKSIRNLEDDMVFKTLRLGKAFRRKILQKNQLLFLPWSNIKMMRAVSWMMKKTKFKGKCVTCPFYFNGNLNDLYESFESKADTFISRSM